VPELPEVETIAYNLRPALTGKIILSSDLLWKRTLAVPSPRAFSRRIRGQKIDGVGRRGKFLFLTLTGYTLLIHLRMSGDLLAILGGYQRARHDRLILKLTEDTTFVFSDPRKFGRVWLVSDPQEVLGRLGPEPLGDEFTPDWLITQLKSCRQRLKPLLVDQEFLAGLGNIYTDEALHASKLHPLRKASDISLGQAGDLWQAIRMVLEDGIRKNGASIDWVYRGGDYQNQFRVYGRQGQPCPVCGNKIEKIFVAQRGTHFCPACQRLEG